MNIRTLLTAAATFAVASAALAQPAQPARLALVEQNLPTANMTIERHVIWASLLEGLQLLGYSEGETITIERWSGSGRAYPDLASLARVVADSSPDVVVVRGYALVEAFQSATTGVPVVGVGEFPSKANGETIAPGGNVTGFNQLNRAVLYDKQLQILHEAVPDARRIAYLGPADYWEGQQGVLVRAAAQRLRLEIAPVIVGRPIAAPSVLRAAGSISPQEFDAIYVAEDPDIRRHRRLVVDMTAGKNLPAIAHHPDYGQFGLMAAYGANILDLYRRAAGYVDQIVKGADVADLPIGEPETFNFVINFVTADRVGVTFPQHLIDEATEFWE